jgi:hypothetical protein
MIAFPSALGGERVGVRGKTLNWKTSAVERLHPSPQPSPLGRERE